MDQTDEELMAAYLGGDSASFDILYQRHSGKVYAYLKKRLSDPEEAAEVFQAVFLKFHRSKSRYSPEFPVAQWLFVISKTALLDHLRKQGRQVPIEDDFPIDQIESAGLSQNPDPSSLIQERSPEILSGLSPEQRRALEMKVLGDMSYEQIAKSLDRSQESVRQMVSRALRKLRSNLSGSDGRSS